MLDGGKIDGSNAFRSLQQSTHGIDKFSGLLKIWLDLLLRNVRKFPVICSLSQVESLVDL